MTQMEIFLKTTSEEKAFFCKFYLLEIYLGDLSKSLEN